MADLPMLRSLAVVLAAGLPVTDALAGSTPQTIAFGPKPALVAGGSATVQATASSGLPVSFSTNTPAVCSVQATSGLVAATVSGTCTVVARQAGDAVHAPAPQAWQNLKVSKRPQTLAFGPAPVVAVGSPAAVQATASSGLPVTYASLTAGVCGVHATSGLVTGLAIGTCRIAANQAGDATWAAAPQAKLALTVKGRPQVITFGPAPVVVLGTPGAVQASAGSGLPVLFATSTAAVCTVAPSTGVVNGLAAGTCTVLASQAGDAQWAPAPQAWQNVKVKWPAGAQAPGAPAGVSARLAGQRAAVQVAIASVDDGGLPVTGFRIASVPAGLELQAATLPTTVNCPTTCDGLAFTVRASNALGEGPASPAAEVLTTFDLTAVFREPDTAPRDTLFTGRLVLNSTTGAITGLTGDLTESMTGVAAGAAPYYDMTRIPLTHLLQTWHDAELGGHFAAVFAQPTTSTFSTLAGGDGWSPAAGIAIGGVYAGFPAPHAGTVKNSYALVFVPDDPFAPLTQAQIDRLAYADCAPGGMMGAVCMTGTSVAGHGQVGTMSGYPLSLSLVPTEASAQRGSTSTKRQRSRMKGWRQ